MNKVTFVVRDSAKTPIREARVPFALLACRSQKNKESRIPKTEYAAPGLFACTYFGKMATTCASLFNAHRLLSPRLKARATGYMRGEEVINSSPSSFGGRSRAFLDRNFGGAASSVFRQTESGHFLSVSLDETLIHLGFLFASHLQTCDDKRDKSRLFHTRLDINCSS